MTTRVKKLYPALKHGGYSVTGLQSSQDRTRCSDHLAGYPMGVRLCAFSPTQRTVGDNGPNEFSKRVVRATA
jgi:hypothetical protein